MPEEWNETFRDQPAERRQFALLLAQLRSVEPSFARASILHADEVWEWQSAIYLLTGCATVWEELGSAIVANCTIRPVREEIEDPRRPWTPNQRVAMEWALHFWMPEKCTASFPVTFRRYLFTRWVVATFLRQGLIPTIRVERP